MGALEVVCLEFRHSAPVLHARHTVLFIRANRILYLYGIVWAATFPHLLGELYLSPSSASLIFFFILVVVEDELEPLGYVLAKYQSYEQGAETEDDRVE